MNMRSVKRAACGTGNIRHVARKRDDEKEFLKKTETKRGDDAKNLARIVTS
jgi:hypothetical protein